MANQQVVLVTGVSEYWGLRVAKRLLAESSVHVIGVDVVMPENMPDGLDFVQADIRNPLLVDLLQGEKVDTVCHLAFAESRRRNEANFDLNVMGTIKVFGAAAEAGVRKMVHRSSTAVYGATPQNPAFLTESHPLQGSRQYGYTRYMVEIEEFCHGFRQQNPDMTVTTLRFANIVGQTAVSPFVNLLKGKSAPMLLGFDPMLQIIHEDDVVEALVYAVLHDVPGVFNVAASGLMPLTRIFALTSTVPVPILHPLAYWGLRNVRGRFSPARLVPLELDYLRYRWVADIRKMQAEMGFTPQYTMEEALKEFAGFKRTRGYKASDDTLEFDQDRLRHTLDRRHRQRERQAAQTQKENSHE